MAKKKSKKAEFKSETGKAARTVVNMRKVKACLHHFMFRFFSLRHDSDSNSNDVSGWERDYHFLPSTSQQPPPQS